MTDRAGRFNLQDGMAFAQGLRRQEIMENNRKDRAEADDSESATKNILRAMNRGEKAEGFADTHPVEYFNAQMSILEKNRREGEDRTAKRKIFQTNVDNVLNRMIYTDTMIEREKDPEKQAQLRESFDNDAAEFHELVPNNKFFSGFVTENGIKQGVAVNLMGEDTQKAPLPDRKEVIDFAKKFSDNSMAIYRTIEENRAKNPEIFGKAISNYVQQGEAVLWKDDKGKKAIAVAPFDSSGQQRMTFLDANKLRQGESWEDAFVGGWNPKTKEFTKSSFKSPEHYQVQAGKQKAQGEATKEEIKKWETKAGNYKTKINASIKWLDIGKSPIMPGANPEHTQGTMENLMNLAQLGEGEKGRVLTDVEKKKKTLATNALKDMQSYFQVMDALTGDIPEETTTTEDPDAYMDGALGVQGGQSETQEKTEIPKGKKNKKGGKLKRGRTAFDENTLVVKRIFEHMVIPWLDELDSPGTAEASKKAREEYRKKQLIKK